MRYAILGLAVIATLSLGQGVGAAQQMQPHDDKMMMHATALEGVVTKVRYVSCSGSTPQSCQGIFEVTPAASGEMMKHEPAMAGDHMMVHPVTVIAVPGTALNWQNSQLLLTKLKVGDQVKLEYFTVDNMNICSSLTMTGMGHM